MSDSPEPPPGWASSWIPDGAPPEGQRAAFRRIAAAVRRMNELLLDSRLPEADLLDAAAAAEALAARFENGPRNRPHWGFGEPANSGNPRAHFESSPLSGLGNPVAPPLALAVENGEVIGRVTFTRPYEGPPGHCHGGFVAAAFDEVLGLTQSMTGRTGMTGTLVVRYRKPTPLYREVRFTGRVDSVDGRKIFTSATLHDGEILCAEAEAIFVQVDFDRLRRLAEQA